MAEILVSESEKVFILHGVEEDLRVDGRSRQDYRPVVLETGIVSTASGSARARLSNSDVLVGAKAEVDTPSPECPNEGRLEFFVDCSANATPEFEGRGGESLAVDIGRCLARAYEAPEVLDLRELCILPGQQCWVLYVDVLILECGGNLFDAVSLAVKAALFATHIPNVSVAAIDGAEPELELSDDPYDTRRLNTEGLPCLVTLTKIGNHFVVDPTPEEESCSSASLVMAVLPSGKITTVRKKGSGSFHPDTLSSMFKVGRDVGTTLNVALMEKLKEEEITSKMDKIGFMH